MLFLNNRNEQKDDCLTFLFSQKTKKFAFKCCWAQVNGKSVDVYKEPVTDKVKKSKKGRLDVVDYSYGGDVRILATVPEGTDQDKSILETVFENGEILKTYTLDEIRLESNKEPYRQYTGWMDKQV